MNLDTLVLEVLVDAVWSGLTALGFGVMFNVPPRALVGCALGGALGHSARLLLLRAGLPLESATFFAAVLIGVWGLWMAQRLRAPTPIFHITSAIPLVPGVIAYRAMIGTVRIAAADPVLATSAPVLNEPIYNLVKVGMLLGAIAVGIALPSLIFRRHKPV